jgi:hypothetical protein
MCTFKYYSTFINENLSGRIFTGHFAEGNMAKHLGGEINYTGRLINATDIFMIAL